MTLTKKQKGLIQIYGAASKLIGTLELAMQNNMMMGKSNTRDLKLSLQTRLQLLQIEKELGIND
jgi:hypothetical protein